MAGEATRYTHNEIVAFQFCARKSKARCRFAEQRENSGGRGKRGGYRSRYSARENWGAKKGDREERERERRKNDNENYAVGANVAKVVLPMALQVDRLFPPDKV